MQLIQDDFTVLDFAFDASIHWALFFSFRSDAFAIRQIYKQIAHGVIYNVFPFSFHILFVIRLLISSLCPQWSLSTVAFVSWNCCKLNDFRLLPEIDIYPWLFRSEKFKPKNSIHARKKSNLSCFAHCVRTAQYCTHTHTHSTYSNIMWCHIVTVPPKFPATFQFVLLQRLHQNESQKEHEKKRNNRHGKSNVIECVALQRISFAIRRHTQATPKFGCDCVIKSRWRVFWKARNEPRDS